MSKFVEFKTSQNEKVFICVNAYEVAGFCSVFVDGKNTGTRIWLSGMVDEFIVSDSYDYVFKEIKEAIA